jgi:hypothetical protein
MPCTELRVAERFRLTSFDFSYKGDVVDRAQNCPIDSDLVRQHALTDVAVRTYWDVGTVRRR